MNNIEELLNKIGKEIFIKHYDDFKNCTDKQALAKKLLEENDNASSLGAQITRINKARQIFDNGLEKQALDIIVSSKKLDEKVISKAKVLLDAIWGKAPKVDIELLDKTLDELGCEIAAQKAFPSKSVFDNLFGDTNTLKLITIEKTGEEFYSMLLRLIDERFGGKSSAVYTKAELTRQDFYRLGMNRKTPKRETVLKFIIAMKLNAQDAEELLKSAGYIWWTASKTDMVIKACVENGIYDTFKVDEELMHNGEETLFSLK